MLSNPTTHARLAPADRQTRAPSLGRLLWIGGAMVFTVLLAVRAKTYWPFTVDDAFITLRYAKHLASGHGPAWNMGGPPQEGYTTALWLAWLTLGEAVGAGLLFAKLSGAVFALLAFAAASKLAGELTSHRSNAARTIACAVPFLFGAAYWPTALHAISGMETTFSAWLLTLFFLCASRSAYEPNSRAPQQTALLALLAILARPEAAVATASTLVVCYFQISKPYRSTLVRAVFEIAVIPGLIYFVCRWVYFGLPLPLSFYVKAVGQPILAGAPELQEFGKTLLLQAPWWCLLLLTGAVSIGRRGLPMLVGSLAMFTFFLFPAHIMGFESRYLFPLVPTLASLCGVGVATLVENGSRLPAVGMRLLAIAAVPLVLIPFPYDHDERSARWINYGRNLIAAHKRLAEDLLREGIDSVAMLDVGAVGYFADRTTIDTFGLNDAHVARTRRQDISYILEQHPAVVVVVSEKPGQFSALFEWEEPLYRGALHQGYQPVCEYRFDDQYYLQALARDRSAKLCPGSNQLERLATQAVD